MSDQLRVDLPALLRAAAALDALAGRTADLPAAPALHRAAAAVPGGRLADAAADRARTAQRHVVLLAAALQDAADGLRAAERTYRGTDDALAACASRTA